MSSETRRASLGWERIRACVPQVHGTEGSRRSTQEWTEINVSRKGRSLWEEEGGMVGGITLCQLTICTMDSCPTEARMTWVSRTQETLILRMRKKCHRADINSPRPGPPAQRLCRMLPIVRPGAQTPGPDLSPPDRKGNIEL